MWAVDSNGSQWVNTNAAITNPLESSSFQFSMTLHTSKGDFLITKYQSVNSSGFFVRVDNKWVTNVILQTRSRTTEVIQASYRKYFSP